MWIDTCMCIFFQGMLLTTSEASSWARPPLIVCFCVLRNPGFSPALCARKKWVPCRKRECSVPLCTSPATSVDKRMIKLPSEAISI